MKLALLTLSVAAAGLAGCASDYVPPRPVSQPGPAYEREVQDGRPGMFGDLRWNVDVSGKREPVRVSEEEDFKRPTLDKYAHESSAYYSTARLWDDGIIDPADTRTVLAFSIAASLNAPYPPKTHSVFRM